MRDTLAQLLAESPTREWMVYLLSTVPGLPPIAQSFHILGIAAVVGSIGMVDLRFLGLALRNQNVSEMIRRLLPWTWVALAVNLVTGSLFVLARPIRYVYNPVVSFKLACLIAAVALAFAIWWMNRREHGYWERTPARLGTARVIAVVSLCCWIGVMLAAAGSRTPSTSPTRSTCRSPGKNSPPTRLSGSGSRTIPSPSTSASPGGSR